MSVKELISANEDDQELKLSGSDESINTMTEDELMECLQNYKDSALILWKENNVYKSVLSGSMNNLSEISVSEVSEPVTENNEILPYSKKCLLARKHLEKLEDGINRTKAIHLEQLKELKVTMLSPLFPLKMESLKLTLKNTQEAEDNFRSDVLMEKHPVTKKVIQQKVVKYLEDSIKKKLAMSIRYKVQIEGLAMNKNKLLKQLKDQNKRLVSIDSEKCQEMRYEHMKTCDSLDKQKQCYAVCKTKCNTLSQKVFELKKTLQREELSSIEEALSKKEYRKSAMQSEKHLNEQREQSLIEAIHKIKIDPRCHDLPEVFDYACVKRENETVKRNKKMWKKKVSVAEQAKLMHANSLKKKN